MFDLVGILSTHGNELSRWDISQKLPTISADGSESVDPIHQCLFLRVVVNEHQPVPIGPRGSPYTFGYQDWENLRLVYHGFL